jgi:molybdate transport system ATP-binding protein
MNIPFLELCKISHVAGSFRLQDISFRLFEGEYLVIAGPTGSGKTMLLELIAGLRFPVRGRILSNGQDITDVSPEKRCLGFAYQDSLLYPFLNVQENILFSARVKGVAHHSGVLKYLKELSEIMEITHLWERSPYFLSGGEKQRVSLARALLLRPPLLLLDEPLSALDSQTKHHLQDLLRFIHQKDNISIIHVTHDQNEAVQLGDRMIILKEGKINSQGIPAEIIAE